MPIILSTIDYLIRFTITKTLEMELPGCNLPGCESHKEKEWPILADIFKFMKSSLKEAVFLLPRCSHDWTEELWDWIDMLAREKSIGVDICTVFTPNQNEDLNETELCYLLAPSGALIAIPTY